VPIKPLNANALTALLVRIDEARYSEIRSLTSLSPTSIEIRFSVQDSARGYDWIDVVFRVDGVKDARLVSDNVLVLFDTREGITVEMSHEGCALAIGNYSGRAHEAPLYIIGTTLGYEELPFSD
jgi:hypothetical protein